VEHDGLKSSLKELGIGSIAFTPLAQGMLTDKYLNGLPAGSRATQGKSLKPELVTDRAVQSIRALNELAANRGQSLAQMAIAWVLRNNGITSALIGASKPEQVAECARAVDNLDFTEEELALIDDSASATRESCAIASPAPATAAPMDVENVEHRVTTRSAGRLSP